MTTEHKTLEQIRDQATIDHFNKTKWAPTEWAVMNFKAGFDASTATHQERARKLIEALEKIENSTDCDIAFEIAGDSLQEWGENDSKD